MRRVITLFLVFSLSLSYLNIVAKDNPIAKKESIIISGNTRFTVLTSRMIRMEWDAKGKFEDRATLAIINRNLETPKFSVRKYGKGVIIKTKDLTLKYSGNGKFSEKNLSVEFDLPNVQGKKVKQIWHPGLEDTENLMGTIRTLDGCIGFDTPNGRNDPYEKGILSRAGWTIIDDSENHVLNEHDSSWKSWVATREDGERQDLYIFAYGHDYKAALLDFTKVAGKIPLPPKYVFGYWWSRFWQYSDFEFVDLAKEIQSYGIPLDVMVVDMDWHDTFTLSRKNPPKDEYGERIGWTGYTWQKQLFPNPGNFLQELKHLGLKTSLNLHPASGIQPYEESYERFVKDYTSRTDNYDGPKNYINSKGKQVSVPFRICDYDWTEAYFNSVIHPLEKDGVDFWWLDWQQWKTSKYTEGLSNTYWLNWTFFNDKVRRTESQGKLADRPLIYHRWGGLGSHRYQIGFSGDTYDEWSALQFLPYFTATSSNVGYGYWGHDIGGHMQLEPHDTDPELYTRWLQYGVFTPIFKTHSTKTQYLERRFWVFPEYFPAMKEAVRLRYSLSPYIYSAARQTYDTGVSMCRPLYYDYPEVDAAYNYKEEFMFGDDILATVLCEPRDSVTALTSRQIWFPEGNDWYDMASGSVYKGGSTKTLTYTIEENPFYLKTGAIIPLASEKIKSLQEVSTELGLFIAPGLGKSEVKIYEDDGKSQAYDTDYAFTRVSKNRKASSMIINIEGREGDYNNMPANRSLKLYLEGVYAPEKVKVNGQEIRYSRFMEYLKDETAWTYDGSSLSLNIYIPEHSASETINIECIWAGGQDEEILRGMKGVLKRMKAITPETKQFFYTYVDRYKTLPASFLDFAQCASRITEDPYNAVKYIQSLSYQALCDMLDNQTTIPELFKTRLKAQAKLPTI